MVKLAGENMRSSSNTLWKCFALHYCVALKSRMTVCFRCLQKWKVELQLKGSWQRSSHPERSWQTLPRRPGSLGLQSARGASVSYIWVRTDERTMIRFICWTDNAKRHLKNIALVLFLTVYVCLNALNALDSRSVMLCS